MNKIKVCLQLFVLSHFKIKGQFWHSLWCNPLKSVFIPAYLYYPKGGGNYSCYNVAKSFHVWLTYNVSQIYQNQNLNVKIGWLLRTVDIIPIKTAPTPNFGLRPTNWETVQYPYGDSDTVTVDDFLFPHLHLLQGDFKTEWFVVVRIQSVFLHRGLLFLQTFASLQQLDLYIGICKGVEDC